MISLNKTLRANLAADHLAKAFYVAVLEANQMPGQTWEHLPIRLRCALIECCGRLLLHLGPIHTNEAMTAAVFELATEVARGTREHDPFVAKRQPTFHVVPDPAA